MWYHNDSRDLHIINNVCNSVFTEYAIVDFGWGDRYYIKNIITTNNLTGGYYDLHQGIPLDYSNWTNSY